MLGKILKYLILQKKNKKKMVSYSVFEKLFFFKDTFLKFISKEFRSNRCPPQPRLNS